MKGKSRNREIVGILGNLKGAEKTYPPELMQARRRMFEKYALILSATKRKKNQLHSGNVTRPSTSMSTVLKTILIFVITASAGTGIYLYCTKLVEVANLVVSVC